MRSGHRSRGQILVVFAGGLVTILVIAALVIDLGFAFMIRRAEQNAADPGAIAAARFIRTGAPIVSGGPGTPEPTRMRQAACFYAQQNGFFAGAAGNVDACIPANDPNGAVLTVNYPPSAGAGPRFGGTPGYVEVVITRNHLSFLASVVGIRNIGVSTNAVAAYSDGDSNSSSLIALDPSGTCATAKTHGTGDIVIHPVVAGTDGGYIHVNSTCANGSPNTTCSTGGGGGGLDLVGSGTITAPKTYVAGTCKGGGTLNSSLTEGAVQIGDPLSELPPPKIADYPAGRCGPGGIVTTPTPPNNGGCVFKDNSAPIHLDPGVYYGGWDIQKNGVVLELGPGVYILAGGGIKLTTGGSITSVQGGAGAPAPVLIYNTDNPATGTGQADLDFTAHATLKLHGIDSGPYRGILVWNDGKGSNPGAQISLEGQVSVDLAGTIYSPKGFVKLEGGSGVGSTASVQIIAWQWDIGGNANLDMPYDPNSLYRFESKGLVH